MKLKIKSIIQTDYKGKVYDLCFNKDHYFFVKHIDNKDLNQYIKIFFLFEMTDVCRTQNLYLIYQDILS